MTFHICWQTQATVHAVVCYITVHYKVCYKGQITVFFPKTEKISGQSLWPFCCRWCVEQTLSSLLIFCCASQAIRCKLHYLYSKTLSGLIFRSEYVTKKVECKTATEKYQAEWPSLWIGAAVTPTRFIKGKQPRAMATLSVYWEKDLKKKRADDNNIQVHTTFYWR